ncbi:hypothetical protein N7523_011162 [Penicillium sp. IBT 18751x]|nr:hypothetical protein N7523_011162 [Penicillium sp. IBT 18751x]
MTEHYHSLRGVIGKRIRQACANCRRRKTKRSGERPVSFLCKQNRLFCVYESYSAESKEPLVSPQAPAGPTTNQSDNSDLLGRLRCLESRIEELSAVPRQQRSLPPGFHIMPTPTLGLLQEPAPDALFPAVGHSAVDPKAKDPAFYGSDLPLEGRLNTNMLPQCLLLAATASAASFSSHGVQGWAAREVSNHYARRSWSASVTEHQSHEEELSPPLVQIFTLLVVVDYTAGRVSAGCIKIGLAARVSQNLHLMAEPRAWPSYTEQEKQRVAVRRANILQQRLAADADSRPGVQVKQPALWPSQYLCLDLFNALHRWPLHRLSASQTHPRPNAPLGQPLRLLRYQLLPLPTRILLQSHN